MTLRFLVAFVLLYIWLYMYVFSGVRVTRYLALYVCF